MIRALGLGFRDLDNIYQEPLVYVVFSADVFISKKSAPKKGRLQEFSLEMNVCFKDRNWAEIGPKLERHHPFICKKCLMHVFSTRKS